MTDSSTSPVPPKEIEQHISRLSNLIVGYRTLFACYRTGNHARADRALTKISAGEGSLSALYHAIASYTLSPEEARAILAVMDAAVVRNAAALHVDALDLGNGLVTLRRIASTEEASQ